MEWQDHGIVLGVRKHGETSAIVSLLTERHGRHAGLVRGGAGRRTRGTLQAGNLVAATWRARLPEHLGTLACELLQPFAAALLADADRLAALTAACALVEGAIPEREPHPDLFAGLRALLEHIEESAWPTLYVRWEMGLLGELGFGLDLSRCAATGRNDQLAYVSPRSGRAVSLAAGEPYRDRMLSLPGFMLESGRAGTAAEIAAALDLTGHFLEHHVFGQAGSAVPAARRRLGQRLAAASATPPQHV